MFLDIHISVVTFISVVIATLAWLMTCGRGLDWLQAASNRFSVSGCGREKGWREKPKGLAPLCSCLKWGCLFEVRRSGGSDFWRCSFDPSHSTWSARRCDVCGVLGPMGRVEQVGFDPRAARALGCQWNWNLDRCGLLDGRKASCFSCIWGVPWGTLLLSHSVWMPHDFTV